MKYRPSRRFTLTVLPSAALVICLGFGIVSGLKKFAIRPIPGEITFRDARPDARRTTTVSTRKVGSSKSPLDWFEEKYENLMTWKSNPWKRTPGGVGDHYFVLRASKDPGDQVKFRELLRRSKAWHQKLLLRYPELAVTMKSIPDDQNGFLKWLDLSDRVKAANPESISKITFPKELDDVINQRGPWNPGAVKDWIAKNQSVVDEIHAIGLMPERSVNGIPVERWGLIDARFGKNCCDIIMLEARLAAEQGNAVAALEAVRAAKGLADHFSEIETPTLLAATVHILLQLSMENHILSDIIPALPAGQVDLVAWENALNPKAAGPAEFARLMKGEWNTVIRHTLLPMLVDTEDPYAVPDAGELLDYLSLNALEIVQTHEAAHLRDLPTLELPRAADTGHLSRTSRQMTETFSVGMGYWRKGWDRSQSASSMTHAAFAIMKGQTIPQDPIYGVDYCWDPATRTLSMPAGKTFDELKIKPIIVPKL
jgi:hypothetical protein